MSGKARNGSRFYCGAYMWLCYKIIHSGLSYVRIDILQATFPNMIFFLLLFLLKYSCHKNTSEFTGIKLHLNNIILTESDTKPGNSELWLASPAEFESLCLLFSTWALVSVLSVDFLTFSACVITFTLFKHRIFPASIYWIGHQNYSVILLLLR